MRVASLLAISLLIIGCASQPKAPTGTQTNPQLTSQHLIWLQGDSDQRFGHIVQALTSDPRIQVDAAHHDSRSIWLKTRRSPVEVYLHSYEGKGQWLSMYAKDGRWGDLAIRMVAETIERDCQHRNLEQSCPYSSSLDIDQ
ncbi:hypothetical protein [Paraferrimonas sedimenticola]|uniref:Lipoprotein n=1 Tax=Paraferrimonas sedimenticola TaxID=375674 RepID=A0AA37RTA6_9GAMM|nr:hypothetical protein [Paraferrimonas sedimenticola]GLP95236.1 hypothetical protein GCM10007895_05420 [Paraferrimonas sedimenticola]